jgi:methylated-DNA-[protein]-cysteine S-methyltransferase
MNFTSKYKSEIGWLKIKGNEFEIHSISFQDVEPQADSILPQIAEKLHQSLDQYFQSGIWNFCFDLKPFGTEFQQKVWKELQKIPFGKTISYLDLAQKLGDEKVIRAAASANGKNPIAILIPCHRVIGKDGSLTGYAGGMHRKKFLLDLEKGLKQSDLFGN